MKNNKLIVWIVVIAVIALGWYLISSSHKQSQSSFENACTVSGGNVWYISSIPPEPQLGCMCPSNCPPTQLCAPPPIYYDSNKYFNGCGIYD